MVQRLLGRASLLGVELQHPFQQVDGRGIRGGIQRLEGPTGLLLESADVLVRLFFFVSRDSHEEI